MHERKKNIALIWYYYSIINNQMENRKRQKLKQYQSIGDRYRDFTRPQGEILMSVMAHQPVSIKRLSELRNISSPAVTQIIDTLEEKEFVVREQDPNDKRSTLVSLSPDYQARVTKSMQDLGEDLFVDGFRALSDEEIEIYVQLTEKISKDLEKN